MEDELLRVRPPDVRKHVPQSETFKCAVVTASVSRAVADVSFGIG